MTNCEGTITPYFYDFDFKGYFSNKPRTKIVSQTDIIQVIQKMITQLIQIIHLNYLLSIPMHN